MIDLPDRDDKPGYRKAFEVFDDVHGDTYNVYLPNNPSMPVQSDSNRTPANKSAATTSSTSDSGGKIGWLCTSIALAVITALALGYAHINSAASSEAISEQVDLSGYYAYSQLDSMSQGDYRIVLTAFESHAKSRRSLSDIGSASRIRDCVLADHPEMLDIEGIQIWSDGKVEGTFSHEGDEARAVNELVNDAAARCLAGMPDGASDYEKAKYLYEWLAENVSYDHEAAAAHGVIADDSESATKDPSQTIEGALVNGRAVCSGYAKAFQYLMQQLGLQCAYVTGEARDGAHAWCLAKLDGEYYYIDPTWGDPQSTEDDDAGWVNYDYLCITSADLAATHVPDAPFPLPDCAATADNYYVREGRLLDSPDIARLADLAVNASAPGKPTQVRCANDEAYSQLCAALENGVLFEHLPEGIAYSYAPTDENRSIALFLRSAT